ncbi:RRM domain-containing protein [Cryptosporidium ubiquitum]|uniref:RRM domain-containing protein n=1 Tax=Cryptosporidium ubiquitum TaxID=857276 RepID=A0A1J4MKC7_9CRYT|nr:RRM domain-containing protein [Cryptosporidium ubiquitum]OII74479.1 RRM domain-containing protein [Cryptosporidium ubiquitum]
MDNLWSDPNVNNKHCQLLFIECELWRLHQAEKHQVPIVNGNVGNNQPSLCVEPSFLDISPFFNPSNVFYFEDYKYFVEVTLFSTNSSANDFENSTGYTAFISGEFLSPQTLCYSKDCMDVKDFYEKIEKQSILDMEEVYKLIGYFLSCCHNKDCSCNFNTLNNNSCIITWDPLKTRSLLNLDLFNNKFASSNNAINYSCSNNLWSKLNSIIGLSELIKSFLPEFWPAFEPSSSLELFSILKNIALSFNIPVEDLNTSAYIGINTASTGYLSLFCKYMAKVSLVLIKKGIIIIHQRKDAISEYKDSSQSPKVSQVRPVVRLRGLPWKTDVLDIIVFFNPICEISVPDIAISYNKYGRMTGEAYVLLPSVRAYELSLALLHGKRMGKRWIEVLPSSTQEFLICMQITGLRNQDQNFPLQIDSSFDRYYNRQVLRLRGLPWSATEIEIVNFFISGGIYDLNVSDVFLGINENQKSSGEAWIILPHKCDAFEVQRILDRRIIGKRYIEVFISSFQELATARSTYSSKLLSKEILHVLNSTSKNNSTCSISNRQRIKKKKPSHPEINNFFK